MKLSKRTSLRGAILLAALLPGCSELIGLRGLSFVDDDAGEMSADGGRDAGVDAGSFDAGFDAGPIDAGLAPGAAPTAIYPTNGAYTGSVHVPDGTPVIDHPLRPKLMWLPVARSTDYQVQIDDSCPTTGFQDCTFVSPELDVRVPGEAAPTGDALVFRPSISLPVSMTPPVGRRYVWRVRACNFGGCSDWSEPRYLYVGRQQNDFDGDGYADLAIGNPGVSGPVSGSVVVEYGSATGPGDGSPTTLVSDTEIAYELFGWAVEAGDLNGDGFADLIVGGSASSFPQSAEGQVFLFYGGADGLPTTSSARLDNPDDQADGAFGQALAYLGDFDADGYADFAAAAPGQSSGATAEGNVFVFLGGTGGVTDTPLRIDSPDNQVDAGFGTTLTSADLNGDGRGDLVVGAPAYTNGAASEGNAFVFYGPNAVDWQRLDNPLNSVDGAFSFSLAGWSDGNGDGFDDLIVSAAGLAYLFEGGREGVSDAPTLELDPGDGESVAFGFSVAALGDVDGDGASEAGILDLIQPMAGSPWIVTVRLVSRDSAGDGYLIAPPIVHQEGGPASLYRGGLYGVGDVDGTGYPDTAVGIVTLFGSTGAITGGVLVHAGGATGPEDPATWRFGASTLGSVDPPDTGAFGIAVARSR